MQLSIILLIAVSALTLLSGISVLIGSKKGERVAAGIFFGATFFALLWAISIAVTLALPESAGQDTAKIFVFGIYLSAPLMCLMLMSYACHPYRLGKIGIALLAVVCLAIEFFIITDPSLLYSSIELNQISGNIVHLQTNWLNILYGAYHFLAVFLFMVGFFYTSRRTKSANVKRANIMVLIGFAITGILALIFDFILPAMGTYNLIWVGPLAMSIAWLFHYYAILRYHLLELSGSALRILSYIIIMTSAAIIYVTIFFVIFSAIFRVSRPSSDIIILNILMIAVAILLFPALNEVSSYIRSLTSVHNVDLVYVVKKLSAMSREYINYRELADFLAEHLHFSYIGILIEDKLISSDSRSAKFASSELDQIKKLKNNNHDFWLPFSKEQQESFHAHGIEAVAELRDTKGTVVGKIIFGRPLGTINFMSRNLQEIETALVLVATAVSLDKGPHTK